MKTTHFLFLEKKLKDILKKQKIKKRVLPKKFLFIAAIVCLLSSIVWLWWRSDVAEVEQRLWAVEVRTMDSSVLPKRVEDFVITTVRQQVNSGARRYLQAAAEVLHSDPRLAAVQVIRAARDRVVVFVDVRRPALVMQVNDKWRYVSRRGDVYGVAHETGIYPVLAGVIDMTRDYRQDDSGLYVLDQREQENVQQALGLLEEAMQNGFICEKIVYEQYRGWQVKIAEVTAVIFFGTPPFAAKLQKLRNILATLRAKNAQAARIELDYEDKAFVQQKKL